MKYYNVKDEKLFFLAGCNAINENGIYRLTEDEINIIKPINDAASYLGTNASGIQVRFITNSKNIKVKAILAGLSNMNHMSSLGQSGLDLYMYDERVNDYIFIKAISKGLIVSCQALDNEPLHGSEVMAKMAIAAKQGGAVAIRANSVVDIKAIKEVVDLPIIGLIKQDYDNSEIYITPTMKEINDLININVDIIAMDATNREQADNVSLKEKVEHIHSKGLLVMADISTLEEGILAEEIGFDIISTTLSGYTPYSTNGNGPDFELVEQLVGKLTKPVVAEGKIFGIDDLVKMASLKPFSIVMGSAITRPQVITKNYVDILKQVK